MTELPPRPHEQPNAASTAPVVPSSSVPPGPSKTAAYLLLAAAGLVVVGSFMPWVKITAAFLGTITKSGTEGGDGWLAIALAAPLAIFAIRRLGSAQSAIPGWIALVISVILGVLTIYEITDVSSAVDEANEAAEGLGHASIGQGLWMLLIGTAVAIIGSFIAIRQRNETTRPHPTAP